MLGGERVEFEDFGVYESLRSGQQKAQQQRGFPWRHGIDVKSRERAADAQAVEGDDRPRACLSPQSSRQAPSESLSEMSVA